MEQTAAQADTPSADAADSSWDELEQRQFLLGILLFRQDFATVSQLMLPGRTVRKHDADCQAVVRLARRTVHRRHALPPPLCLPQLCFLWLLLLQVQEVQQFHAYKYTFTKAHAHVHALEALGFQPGAVVTGVMRTRLLHNMATGAGAAWQVAVAVLLLWGMVPGRELLQTLVLHLVHRSQS